MRGRAALPALVLWLATACSDLIAPTAEPNRDAMTERTDQPASRYTEPIATIAEAREPFFEHRLLDVTTIETPFGVCFDLDRLPPPWTVQVHQKVEWERPGVQKSGEGDPPGNLVLSARYDELGLPSGEYDPTFAPSRDQEVLDVWVLWRGHGPSTSSKRLNGTLGRFLAGKDFRTGRLGTSYPATDEVIGKGRYAMRRYGLPTRPTDNFYISEDDRIACYPTNYDPKAGRVYTNVRNPFNACAFRVRGADIRAAYSLPSGGMFALDRYHRAVESAIDTIAIDCAQTDAKGT